MTPDTIHRLTKLLWQQIVFRKNPWGDAMAAGLPEYRERRGRWYDAKTDLTRAMFGVVFGSEQPSEDLIVRALDFLEGATR